MSDDALTLDEVRRMALAIGLDRLSEEHLRELHRAANTAHARRKALASTQITPADEPAPVYRLERGGAR